MLSLPKTKVFLLIPFGVMLVGLLLYSAALATPDWLEMPCGDDHDVKMGLWKMCLEPGSDCVSFADNWGDVPGWVESVVAVELIAFLACVVSSFLMLCYLIIRVEAAQESLSGLGFAALATGSFMILGQMLFISEKSRVYELFLSLDKFSYVDCEGETGAVPKAAASSAYTVVWVATAVVLCAGLLLVTAGSFTPKPVSKATAPRKLRGVGHAHDNPEFSMDDENHNKKRRTATKMIDAYRIPLEPIPTTSHLSADEKSA